jgi:nucleoside-diphosphate-sugar epimerase
MIATPIPYDVSGTRKVLAAAERRGARVFIHTATGAASGHHDQPIDEKESRDARSN